MAGPEKPRLTGRVNVLPLAQPRQESHCSCGEKTGPGRTLLQPGFGGERRGTIRPGMFSGLEPRPHSVRKAVKFQNKMHRLRAQTLGLEVSFCHLLCDLGQARVSLSLRPPVCEVGIKPGGCNRVRLRKALAHPQHVHMLTRVMLQGRLLQEGPGLSSPSPVPTGRRVSPARSAPPNTGALAEGTKQCLRNDSSVRLTDFLFKFTDSLIIISARKH